MHNDRNQKLNSLAVELNEWIRNLDPCEYGNYIKEGETEANKISQLCDKLSDTGNRNLIIRELIYVLETMKVNNELSEQTARLIMEIKRLEELK